MSTTISGVEPATLDDILAVLVNIRDILDKDDGEDAAGDFDSELDTHPDQPHTWDADLPVRLRHCLHYGLEGRSFDAPLCDYTRPWVCSLRNALALHEYTILSIQNCGRTSANQWNEWRRLHGYGPTPGNLHV